MAIVFARPYLQFLLNEDFKVDVLSSDDEDDMKVATLLGNEGSISYETSFCYNLKVHIAVIFIMFNRKEFVFKFSRDKGNFNVKVDKVPLAARDISLEFHNGELSRITLQKKIVQSYGRKIVYEEVRLCGNELARSLENIEDFKEILEQVVIKLSSERQDIKTRS